MKLVDLTGKEFGRLKVKERDLKRSSKHTTFWICKCKCGNVISVRRGNLFSGQTTSCGCYRRELRWNGCGNLSGTYWKDVKHSAKQRGLEFSITKEDAWKLFEKQGGKCALSGLPLNFVSDWSRNKKKQTASLDRIDNTKGYTLDNIQWLHRRINFMKHTMTVEEFIGFCEAVVEFSKAR